MATTECVECNNVAFHPITLGCAHVMCIECAYLDVIKRRCCKCGIKVTLPTLEYDRQMHATNFAGAQEAETMRIVKSMTSTAHWSLENVRTLFASTGVGDTQLRDTGFVCKLGPYTIVVGITKKSFLVQMKLEPAFDQRLWPFTPLAYDADSGTLDLLIQVSPNVISLAMAPAFMMEAMNLRIPSEPVKLFPSALPTWQHMTIMPYHWIFLRPVPEGRPKIKTNLGGRRGCYTFIVSYAPVNGTEWLCAKVYGPDLTNLPSIQFALEKVMESVIEPAESVQK